MIGKGIYIRIIDNASITQIRARYFTSILLCFLTKISDKQSDYSISDELSFDWLKDEEIFACCYFDFEPRLKPSIEFKLLFIFKNCMGDIFDNKKRLLEIQISFSINVWRIIRILPLNVYNTQ